MRVINYDPQKKDTLTRLVKGKIPLEQARVIVEPNYQLEIVPEEKPKVTSETETLPSEIEEEIEEETIAPEIPSPSATSETETTLPETETETDQEVQQEIKAEEFAPKDVSSEVEVVKEKEEMEMETPISGEEEEKKINLTY